MGIYNGQPDSRALVTALADGYLAHGKLADNGIYVFPNEINWRTDAERGGEMIKGSGDADPMHTFWAAYRWTDDEKYLRPILYRVDRKGVGSIDHLNENLLDVLGRRDDGAGSCWRRPPITGARAASRNTRRGK